MHGRALQIRSRPGTLNPPGWSYSPYFALRTPEVWFLAASRVVLEKRPSEAPESRCQPGGAPGSEKRAQSDSAKAQQAEGHRQVAPGHVSPRHSNPAPIPAAQSLRDLPAVAAAGCHSSMAVSGAREHRKCSVKVSTTASPLSGSEHFWEQRR